MNENERRKKNESMKKRNSRHRHTYLNTSHTYKSLQYSFDADGTKIKARKYSTNNNVTIKIMPMRRSDEDILYHSQIERKKANDNFNKTDIIAIDDAI